jgi:hypothetical protein
VFGPSLEEIARKWREMAAPRSDGEKLMVIRESSPAQEEIRLGTDEQPRD